MAIFRKIHVSFWSDPFVMDLTPEQKVFFLYILTNDKTRQCGIYELPVKKICFDTGFSEDVAKKLINFFVAANRIKYSANSREIALKNWNRYNGSDSPKVFECICTEIQTVKDDALIQYVYGMDRVSILKRNKNKNKNKKKTKEEEQEEVIPELNIAFDAFWEAYDKKMDRAKCEPKWDKLTDAERAAIMEYIPKYKAAQPDKQFRKNPEAFLNSRGWENEIVSTSSTPVVQLPAKLDTNEILRKQQEQLERQRQRYGNVGS